MEVTDPRSNQQTPPSIPPPSNYSRFTEQARRAGYMGPDIGQTRHQLFRDHHHSHQLHPQPRPFHHPHPQPHDVHEAIQREIEKERIREEIIMSEIARRRVLEAEVRRELMMERELTLRRGGDGFSFSSFPQIELESPMRLSPLGTRAEGRTLEERIAMSIEETKRLNGRHEIGGFDTLPFQRGTAGMRTSEVKPAFEGGKEKQKVIFLARPDENISGSKRKAATPPEVDASELPSNVILKKKAEQWSCAICLVSATSERGLNEHLQGKKHKSKEAALRAQRDGKNYSIGLFPKKATKSVQATQTVDLGAEQGVKFVAESLVFKKTREGSPNRWDLPSLLENQNTDKLGTNQSELVGKVQKCGGPNNKRYRFWCEMCNVGTFSKKVMNAHEKGKKHVNRLRERGQKGGAGQSHLQKIVQVVNHAETVAEDEKNITKDNFDETFDEMSSKNDKLMDAVEPEDQKLVEETKEEDDRAVDVMEPEKHLTNDELVDAVEPEDQKPVEETKEEGDGAMDITEPEKLLNNDVAGPRADRLLIS